MNDDQTKNLANENVPTTQPMLKEILERMNDGFAEVNTRLDRVDGRLEKIDSHLEKVDGRLEKIDGHLEKVDGRLEAVEKRLEAAERELKSLNKRFDIFTIDLGKVRGDVYDLDKRVEPLEKKAS